jgi:hypothetical protein
VRSVLYKLKAKRLMLNAFPAFGVQLSAFSITVQGCDATGDATKNKSWSQKNI